MKELGRAMAMSLTAAVLGLIMAPQLLFAIVRLLDGVLPAWLLRPLAHAAYEIGLWGVGLVAAWAAWRLAWLARRALLVALVAAPAALEGAFALWVGQLPPGLASGVGVAVRLSVAAAMVTGAALLARPREPLRTPAVVRQAEPTPPPASRRG